MKPRVMKFATCYEMVHSNRQDTDLRAAGTPQYPRSPRSQIMCKVDAGGHIRRAGGRQDKDFIKALG